MVLDSWLDSVYSDDSWKRFHLASCGRPASASHQNQRAHRFTCSGGFLCWALVVPSLFFCRRGSNWPRPYASLADFVTWLFRYGSIINLCSLALDRYMAVVKPLQYVNFMPARRITQLTLISWFIHLCLAICSVFIFDT